MNFNTTYIFYKLFIYFIILFIININIDNISNQVFETLT